jgi:hypothetical protein
MVRLVHDTCIRILPVVPASPAKHVSTRARESVKAFEVSPMRYPQSRCTYVVGSVC